MSKYKKGKGATHRVGKGAGKGASNCLGLSRANGVAGVSFFPQRVGLQQGIEDQEQLMHAGHERQLLGFAGSEQSLVEDADHRIAAGSHQRRHVQRCAHARATAPDEALAAHLAAVAVEGAHANQRADLNKSSAG